MTPEERTQVNEMLLAVMEERDKLQLRVEDLEKEDEETQELVDELSSELLQLRALYRDEVESNKRLKAQIADPSASLKEENQRLLEALNEVLAKYSQAINHHGSV